MVLQSAAFAGEALFRNHSVPMWIYDLDSLAFLEVNDAAIARYGWSRDEFLSMTIADIRPAEDLPALRENLSRVGDGLDRAGVWRHRLKSGRIIHVEIISHALAYRGRRAEMVSAHDVTAFVEFERDHAALLSALPGSFVVLTPDDHRIMAVSESYLNEVGAARAALVARRLFELAPERPDGPQAEAILALRASLERAARTGERDRLELPCHPLRSPTPAGMKTDAVRWRSSCHPVRTADGMLRWIVHRLEAIDSVAAVRGGEAEGGARAEPIGQEGDDRRLVDLARRLLGIGTWRLDLDSGELRWSDDVYRMYGVAPSAFGHSFEAYVECVHPDDREPMRSRYAEFIAGAGRQFAFEHRIVRSDGRIAHVRGVGELSRSAPGRILAGIVQDITALLESDARLSETTSLLRLAGRAARLGGWRVDLAAQRVHWSAETAAIHEEPDGTSPDLEAGIRYYAPEFRDRVRTVFGQCAETGRGFDEVLQLVTARGRRIWVRAIGEAVRDAQGRIVAVQGAFQDIDDLMSAQARSVELSRRLGETLEHISDAFFTLDHDWNFSFLNSQAERLLDRRREDLVGRNVWAEFPAAIGTTFQREYERAVTTRQTARFSEYYAPLQTHFEVSAYPAPDGLAVYFRDVTKERERTEQLRLLEAAISRVNDILVITDAESIDRPHGPCIVFVNEAFVRKTGYSRDYAIGKTPRFLQGPRTQRRELARIRTALAEGRPVRAELVNYTRSREEIWLELDIVPVTDDQGRQTHWVSVERDVTGRKLAEQALQASEERFRLVAQATNDVIWDWDLVHDAVWWNESMSSVFGHDRSRLEPGPASWMNRIHVDDRERVVRGIHAVIDGAAANWSDEYRFLRADGSAAIVVDRGFVIRDEAGRAIRMLGSMTDMSSRRELDERLKQAQRLEAVGQLTGGVAHDFNNLLTVILGNAEILREQLTDQQQLRMLAEMTATAAARGAELTRRLLAFARRQPLEPRRVNVNELLGAMDGLLRRAVSEDIDIELVRGGGLWLTEIDPVQLESALLNLALNARDAMPGGGRLTIETANAALDDLYSSLHEEVDPGQYVMISVSDSGAGMTPEVAARAFDPFFTTKDVGKGSGLGLSMVYGFVKQSGGHAKIYTEPGEGTTVRLYLPRALAGAAQATTRTAAAPSIGGGEHILVVEDDALVRGHLVSQLEGLGYRVTAAHDGPSALEIIGRMADAIDLLFTDVVMPGGMNGRELADAARAIRADLKVLFTSGYTENAIVHHGRLDRGVHLLGKPYRRQELAAKVRKVLDET